MGAIFRFSQTSLVCVFSLWVKLSFFRPKQYEIIKNQLENKMEVYDIWQKGNHKHLAKSLQKYIAQGFHERK